MPNGQTYTEVVVKLLSDVDVIKSELLHDRESRQEAKQERKDLTSRIDKVLDSLGGQDRRITTLEQCAEDTDTRVNRIWTMFWAQLAALMGVAWAAIKALVVQ